MRRKIRRSVRTPSSVHRRVFRPALGWLERRVLLSGNPTYYTVNLTTDTNPTGGGVGSGTTGDLRYCITQADDQGEAGYNPANSLGSVMSFDPTVFATPQTITLSSTLVLSESAGPEVIDGPSAGVVISGNNAVGVFQVDGGVTATLSGLTISGGSATNGGGIDNCGTLTVTDSTIAGNGASNNGGGIDNLGTLAVTDSTISGGAAGYNGGGIENTGMLTLTNSTIAENYSNAATGGVGMGGGGIDNFGTLRAVNATIAENVSGGGGLNDETRSTSILDNTIVALNTNGYAAAEDITGGPVSLASAYNLIGTGGSGGLTNGTHGNLVGVADPGLSFGLANAGGPTQTIALLPGSPAIGAGSVALANAYSLTTDQRGAGFPRIVNGTVDIGAFESPVFGNPTAYTVNLTSDTGAFNGANATTATTGDLLWAITQANANTNPAGSVITFDPTVFSSSSPQTITLTSTLELSEAPWPEVIQGPGANTVTISGNNVVGVFQVDRGTTATLSGLTITEGSTANGGGGINNAGALTVTGCTIAENLANVGGGISNSGTLTVTGATIEDNSGFGGGVLNSSAWPAMFTDSTIKGNSNLGVAIEGELTVANCTIADNSLGGIYLYGGSLTLTNSTVTANGVIGGVGDGWSGGSSVTLRVTNCTIADNSGGGITVGYGALTLDNSIVALDGDTTGAPDIQGTPSSLSAYNNLVGVDGTGDLAAPNGNIVGVNPLLGPLANNGGPTETMALLPGSLAIGKGSVALAVDANGNTLTTDQRGEPRIVNGEVDVGAFEGQEENSTTTVTASPATSVSGQSVTFTATVTPQAGSPITTPTGSVQFEIDGSDFGSPVPLVDGSATSAAVSSLSVATHAISADYTSNSADFIGSTGGTSTTVESLNPTNLQSVVSAAETSGGTVTLAATTTGTLTSMLGTVSNLPSSTSGTIIVDLSSNTTYQQQDSGGNTIPIVASAPSGTTLTILCSTGNATVYDLQASGGNVSIHGGPSGTITVVGMSPALTVNGGSVTIGSGVTLLTAASSPTILVSGGSLTIRDATVEESSGSAQAAILITGGTVDLGTIASPGGNIFNVNGTGTLIENNTSSAIPAIGDTFENNGAAVASNFGAVSLTAPPAQTANQGVSQLFSLGSLTDTANDSQSWAVDINWGDGSNHTDFSATSTGSLGAQSHAFAIPGMYTVAITAADPVASGVTAWDLVQAFTVIVAPSIFILDPSAGGALSLSGNAGINIPGAVFVDSSSSSALSASGNATIKASVIDVHGKVQKGGNASFSPAPVTGSAVLSDPLSGLAVPVASRLGLASNGSLSLSGNSAKTIGPGVYSQISLSGNASLTLNPGVYIITGGGLAVSGNASVSVSGPSNTITGTGVMIYNAGSGYNPTTGADGGSFGAVTLSGNGTIKLNPPSAGTYAGILVFQARDNAKALTLSGNALQGVAGVIYAPAAQLGESGNAQIGSTSNPISIVVDTLSASGNAIADGLTLSAPTGSVAYSPAQIRSAYGISALLGAGLLTPALDGTGETIAIVDAYDDPSIFQSLDAFDSQFGLTASGPTLYAQYGPASSFLTVLNQSGQATSLPSTDPNGPGTDNWEVEEALDVEWAHAVAPGAQIVLVEANSQSLSDLMASVATAASQPGVSVVSMSWGFPEGQAVFAADEAAYDSVFNVPGVTFVASTGDYGAADPEYPAFSPNVVAVGGTSLTLNADGSYNSETGWGYYSSTVGALIASGGGISLYEPEPAYQQGVQSTGYRTTPDVSLVADPATGAWIADPYNLDPSNPFEVVGGTSLSAPAWAGLVAIVNQGRAAAGESSLNSTTPADTQQALYMLPQNDYNAITSGNNGYTASAGYNLVTGLGTPVANLLVPDLIAYQGAGTTYSGSTVAPLQNSGLVNTGTSDSGPMDVFSVFDSFTVTNAGLKHGRDAGVLDFPVERGPVRKLSVPTNAMSSAVDRVVIVMVDETSRETLIGDLAFEQVSSGTHKELRGSSLFN